MEDQAEGQADSQARRSRAPLPSRPRRLVFLGTPEVAVPSLRGIHAAGWPVDLVVTGSDKRRGRGSSRQPSPVKAAAAELGLPVSHDVDDVLATPADLGVVVAFGRLIRPHVLARLPMVNVHFSALPRWRGAAPVERAILAGDPETAVCVMQVVEELDAGGVLACETTAIAPDEELDGLRVRLADLGADLLVRTLAGGLGPPRPQVGEVTYAHKLGPDDHHLDWHRPAADLARVVRLGRAWTTFRGRRLRVLRGRVDPGGAPLAPGVLDGTSVGTGAGRYELLDVQPEGRGRQAADAWCRGARIDPGERLGS